MSTKMDTKLQKKLKKGFRELGTNLVLDFGIFVGLYEFDSERLVGGFAQTHNQRVNCGADDTF